MNNLFLNSKCFVGLPKSNDFGALRLDLTGGAPELNPYFRRLVIAARALNVEVIDRCNLTVLLESGQEDLAEFLAGQEVEIRVQFRCTASQIQSLYLTLIKKINHRINGI